jgi:hypothetical protein
MPAPRRVVRRGAWSAGARALPIPSSRPGLVALSGAGGQRAVARRASSARCVAGIPLALGLLGKLIDLPIRAGS